MPKGLSTTRHNASVGVCVCVCAYSVVCAVFTRVFIHVDGGLIFELLCVTVKEKLLKTNTKHVRQDTL